MRQTLPILFTQSFGKGKVGHFVAIRPQIVRSIIELRSNGLWWDKFLDLNFASWLRLDALEFFVVEDHKTSRLDLKALLNIFVGDFVPGFGLDHMLLDSSL